MWPLRVESMTLLLFLLSLQSQVALSALSLESTGLTVVLDSIPFYISPYSSGEVSFDPTALSTCSSVNGFYPITVLDTTVSTSDFPALMDNLTSSDDVFQPGFMQAVFMPNAVPAGSNYTENGTTTVVFENFLSPDIPKGPYFLEASTGMVYMTYRLYSDFAGAFTEPLMQMPGGNFTYLSAQIPGSASLTVGVPSRLYYTPSAAQPLAGVRVGIKDIYDLAGVRTSDGNRAYYNLYAPRNASALVVQKLIDAGAIVVGKQKTSQFANGEEATADWVDYHSPFNPRGDGYQDPSSSSAGAGASIGSYPWLDMAVGSDTGGSIRGPSQVQGLFGNRPSHGLVALTGVMPLAPELDTAGFLTRDPFLWGVAQQVLYDGLANFTGYPKKVYTYQFPTNASSSEANGVILNFLTQLSAFLSANVTSVNLTSMWSASYPTNTSAYSDLTSLLNITYPILISKEQINLVRTPFYADYGAVHDGRLPFVDPAPLVRWAFGDSYPASALSDAVANKTLFMNWFQSNVLKPDNRTCSDSLMLYVGSDGESNARNQYSGPPKVPFGFSAGRISVIAEVPDSVFPIGQASFHSNITNHTESLPVTVDIMAAKGCDAVLFRLAQDLVNVGVLQVPLTGYSGVAGGEVLFKRGSLPGGQERVWEG